MELIHRNTDYAIRALISLAALKEGECMTSAQLARAGSVPVPFMRKLMRKLVAEQLAVSVRGARGGYCLARNPEVISVLTIMEIVQGPFLINRCSLPAKRCPRRAKCPVRKALQPIQLEMRKTLSSVPLSSLLLYKSRGRLEMKKCQ